jgi:hypothetical protein
MSILAPRTVKFEQRPPSVVLEKVNPFGSIAMPPLSKDNNPEVLPEPELGRLPEEAPFPCSPAVAPPS